MIAQTLSARPLDSRLRGSDTKHNVWLSGFRRFGASAFAYAAIRKLIGTDSGPTSPLGLAQRA